MQVQIAWLLAVYQMNVRVNLDLWLKRHQKVHQSKQLHTWGESVNLQEDWISEVKYTDW